jgi:hypothetical protein
MSFDSRDIRRSMDVYTADNTWLGEVLSVEPGPEPPGGEQVGESARQHSAINGELLGPAPTAPIGNRGPHAQSAAEAYAVSRDAARRLGQGSILVGRWWGLFARRTIPLSAVQTVGLERVVLKHTKAEIDRVAA